MFDLLHIFIDSRDLQLWFEEPIVHKLMTVTEAQTIVMKEFEKLQEDRIALRSIFPSGNATVRTHANGNMYVYTCTCTHIIICTCTAHTR